MVKNKDKNKEADVNALEILKSDHDKVKELFWEYEAAGDRAHKKKRDIAKKAFVELEVPTNLEEEMFPEAEEQLGEELQHQRRIREIRNYWIIRPRKELLWPLPGLCLRHWLKREFV